MSELEPGSPLDKGRPDEGITDFDRRVMASLTKWALLPPDFKEYMVQYLTLNQPPIPAGQIPGLFRAVPRVLAQSTEVLDVVNTTSETTLLSEVIPGGTLGSDGTARIIIKSDYLNNSGAVRNFDVRLKWGGSTVIGTAEGTGLTSATRAGMQLEFTIANLGDPASNQAFGEITMAYPQALSIAGFGDNSGAQLPERQWFSAVQSVDTNAAQTVAVSIQHSFAHASLSWRRQSYTIEVLG